MGRFEVRDERARAGARNAGTLMIDTAEFARLRGISCEVAFITHYDHIRATCAAVEGRGLVVFAIDEEGIAATAVLASRTDGIDVAILGRHGKTDLWLGHDPAMALRHLAVITLPTDESGRCRYRVLDLRTRTGFTDELDTPIRGFDADGPVFARVGQHTLLFVTVDGREKWPLDPLRAWDVLPDRVYREADVVPRHRPKLRRTFQDVDVTGVRSIPGPAFVGRHEAGTPMGELAITCQGRNMSLRIGDRQARGGVLLGRYDRCDTARLPVLTHPDVSRVHLLLLELDGQLYAIDTASTNGVWKGQHEVRGHRLAHGDTLTFGRDLAFLEWSVVH
jgi:hypothetical protein